MVSTFQVDATDVGEHAYLVLRESDRYRFFDKSGTRLMRSGNVESGLR